MVEPSNSKGGGGTAHDRKKALRSLQRSIKVLGLAKSGEPGTMQQSVAPVPTMLARSLGFIEHPLFIGSVAIVSGLIGIFVWRPVLLLCGICIVLAFHRSGVAVGSRAVVKIFLYGFLLVGVTVLLLWVDGLLTTSLAKSKTEITDSVVSGLKKALGISRDAKLVRITKFDVYRVAASRAVEIDVYIKSTAYAEPVSVEGSYRISLEDNILKNVVAERQLEQKLWDKYVSGIDSNTEKDAAITVKPDIESIVPIGNSMSDAEFSSLDYKIIYFMGRFKYIDMDKKTQYAEFCGFSAPKMQSTDVVLCRDHNN